MHYLTKYNYRIDEGFPPLLARLTDDPPSRTSAELYLALPKKWVPIGEPVISEMMSTGEWDPVWPHGVDALIERIEARRWPSRSRYWLVSLDPDAPHVIVRSFDDGPFESYAIDRRQYVTVPADDPVQRADRANWNEMLRRETGVVRQCLEHDWHHRRAFPNADAEHR
jgi:hypothetical protein